ncbi:MAG: hypothetical protein DWQ47_17475 [Acidobacteria bacterium]|nr:MAG: hypothetical protein DWQ32_04875 [Acidobacteriota bacterium]REK02170.1 MAG: hypothetical protein DWQ38_07280 [Acidobacteriota bacterium]REK14028.1 MAG: hypothetical protein DWQ43_10565 [Acidobacteriota bacterium]REK42023.1 MAG: hypothetical protein DWQ47_17475 [Acidobacteriota bacterium]
MARSTIFLLLLIAFSPGALAQDEVKITLVNGTETEKATQIQLERLIADHDLSKWTFTKEVRIEDGVIPHSHPVLTLSTRHLKDDELLLSTYVHEQIHWFLSDNRKKTDAAKAEFRKKWPDVPSGGPEGARDEDSTYLHIAVVYLEYRAVRELLGELRAMSVMDFWKRDHYRWIYRTVQESPREVGKIMFDHGLIPREQTAGR